MTSKISFPKLIKEDMKKRAWLLASSAVIFMIIIPLVVMMQIDSQLSYLGDAVSMERWREIREWFVGIVGLKNFMLTFAVMFGAIICGITSFSYLHSKSQMDFYHSLPVKRQTWFAVTFVSSFMQIMIPYLIGYACTVMIGAAKKVTSPGVFRQCTIVFGVTILFFLLFYSITILAMILTGKLLVAMFGLMIFMFGGALVGSLRIYIMMQSFETFVTDGIYYGVIGNIIFGRMSWYSPVFALGNIVELYSSGESMVKPLVLLSICTLLIAALALWLYQKRATESAGKAIAFPKLKPVIKVMVAITAGLFFGAIMGGSNLKQEMNAAWLFGIGILATVLACAVVEFVYHADIRMIFKHKCSLGIAVFGTVAILSVAKYDLFGYDSYLPKEDKIEAMAVISYQARDIWVRVDDWEDKEYTEQLEALKLKEFHSIYELAKNGSSSERTGKQECVTVAYYLKSGRKVYREYFVDEDVFDKCMTEIMKDESYRESLFGLDELQQEEIERYQFENFRHEMVSCILSTEKQKKLIEAYKRDVLSQTVSEFTGGNVIGEFSFIFKGEGDYIGNIYESFTETIKLLREYGYEVPMEIKPEEVQSITITDYNEVESPDGKVIDKTRSENKITDPAEIQKILERICYKESAFTEPNIYVDIEFRNGDVMTFLLRKE